MLSKLVVITGRDKGRVFSLPEAGTFHIGRGQDTATRLNDLRVSRSHCHLQISGDELLITDTQSREGTFINKERLARNTPHPLKAGDVINVGDTELRLEVEQIFDAPTMGADQLGALAAVPPSPKREPLMELVGTTLAHYRVGEVLVQGTAGVLFRARDTRADQEVVLKVIRPELLKGEADMQRVLRGLRALVNVRHPNLVAVYDADQTDAYCWGALEYVEGDNLAQRIERAGAEGMHWEEALRVALHVGRALDLLAQHRRVHGGIVPRHILVQARDNVAKLNAPFRITSLEKGLADRAAGGGEALRDLAYLPPERVRGEARGDSRADIYSLGAIVYTLLAGRPPLAGKTATDLAARILRNEVVRPKELQPSLPNRVERVVLRMLAQHPEDRYPTPADLLADLERVVQNPEEPAVAPAPPLPPPAPPLPPAEEAKISVTCACGQVLQAKTKYAGTRVRCPVCGSELILPGRATARPSVPSTPAWRRPERPPAAAAPEMMPLPGESSGYGLPKAIIYGVVAMIVVAALLFFGGTLIWEWARQSASPGQPTTTRAKAKP
jgi:serine/threonine protein kinase